MKTLFSTLAVALTAGALTARPVITDVALVNENDRNKNVVVTYTLADEDAIVTAAFTADDVSIPPAATTNLTGDVNARVGVGVRRFVWPVRAAFPQTVLKNLKVHLTAWSVGQPPAYVAFDLTGRDRPRYYVSDDAVPGGVLSRTYKTDKLLMRRIPAAGVEAKLGDVTGARTSECPMRLVSFTEDYYIGVFELTSGQCAWMKGTPMSEADEESAVKPTINDPSSTWEALRGKGFSWPAVADGQASAHAVDATSLLGKLRTSQGYAFDLPTDAQWEFAARAGQRTDYPGADASSLLEYGWYKDETNDVVEVGLKRPNGFGLYDMGGNALEHVLDLYGTSAETPAYGSRQTDPVGPTTPDEKSYRTRRGGSCGQTCVEGFAKVYARIPYGFDNWAALTAPRLVCPVCPIE